MLAVLLFGLVATAAAAPQFHHHGPHHSHFRNDPFADDIFDTRQFWAQLANEMRQIDDMLASFNKRFPSHSCDSGVVGNEYKITIPLNGFDEKDIVVKAKEGFMIVQAVHKIDGGSERMYMDAKTLSSSVNVTGTWTFEQGVLKIVFPLKTDAVKTTEATKVDVTEMPVFKDREEMDNKSEESDMDADVGLRGDLDKTELELNEIPRDRVEATTYTVDLKGDVELVPVHSSYQL